MINQTEQSSFRDRKPYLVNFITWDPVKYIWNSDCTAVVLRLNIKVKSDHRSKFSNLQLEGRSLRATTGFEPVTSARGHGLESSFIFFRLLPSKFTAIITLHFQGTQCLRASIQGFLELKFLEVILMLLPRNFIKTITFCLIVFLRPVGTKQRSQVTVLPIQRVS